MEHFNKLTPAEAERLAFLIEELSEVQKAACKVLRHGYASYNPYDRSAGNNRKQLEDELGHVSAAIRMMIDADDLRLVNLEKSRIDKMISVKEWMHHQDA